MSDMYTDIERSIWMTIADRQAKQGTDFPVFNNLVTKKDFPMSSGALSIMKASDVPNFENGGGTQAFIQSTALDASNNAVCHTMEDWPQFYNLLYQFVVLADDLASARQLDALIRHSFVPRAGILMYDSDNSVWTKQRVETQYAGYINRDVPASFKYWRVTMIRFEVPDYMTETKVIVPAIQGVSVSVGGETSHVGGLGLAVLNADIRLQVSVDGSLLS